MPEQKILSSRVWCPCSGFAGKDKAVIPPHKIQLMECANGTLYGWCSGCHSKVFIQNKEIIRRILEVSTVIKVIQKRISKVQRQEGRNVAS